jgi:hypothetical protein
MKTILAILGAIALVIALIGCRTQKEIQVEMVQAELVKIDTIVRQFHEQKLFTWRDKDNILYVSFMPMNYNYPIGSSMVVFRAR